LHLAKLAVGWHEVEELHKLVKNDLGHLVVLVVRQAVCRLVEALAGIDEVQGDLLLLFGLGEALMAQLRGSLPLQVDDL